MKSSKPALYTSLSPALLHLYDVSSSIVVIIDVLRATSTIATVLANGAKHIIPVDSVLLDDIRLENEVRFRYQDYEVLGFLFAHKFDRFTVVAAATDIYGFKKVKNLKEILLSVFVISLFLISRSPPSAFDPDCYRRSCSPHLQDLRPVSACGLHKSIRSRKSKTG